MADGSKKKGYAQQAFNDAGTGESFKEGQAVNVDVATYANYEAAGLVGEKAPKSTSEAAPAAN